LHTSFNRVETGTIRKISLSFRFVAVSRKKSFHISVMSHNAEVKLCNHYQFAEAFNGIASFKIFVHLSCSITSLYNKLHLTDALFARSQTRFGIGQTV